LEAASAAWVLASHTSFCRSCATSPAQSGSAAVMRRYAESICTTMSYGAAGLATIPSCPRVGIAGIPGSTPHSRSASLST